MLVGLVAIAALAVAVWLRRRSVPMAAPPTEASPTPLVALDLGEGGADPDPQPKKPAVGELSLESVDFDPAAIATDVVRLLEPLAQEKRLELIVLRDAALPGRVVGDPLRLRQVLVNLVGNAIKFTEKGRVELDAPLIVLLTDEEGSGLATVEQAGYGVWLSRPLDRGVLQEALGAALGQLRRPARSKHRKTFTMTRHRVAPPSPQSTTARRSRRP